MVTVLLASRTMPPLAISAYVLNSLILLTCALRAMIAAVSVVLPWSMWPIVPTLTCGLVRSNVPLAIAPRSWQLDLLVIGRPVGSGRPVWWTTLPIPPLRPSGGVWAAGHRPVLA